MRMERGENPSKAFRMATAAWNGLQGTVTAIVYASSYYASSLLLHTPADLHHHINNYTFGGAFEPPVKSDLLPGIGKRFLNAADYFFRSGHLCYHGKKMRPGSFGWFGQDLEK